VYVEKKEILAKMKQELDTIEEELENEESFLPSSQKITMIETALVPTTTRAAMSLLIYHTRTMISMAWQVRAQ